MAVKGKFLGPTKGNKALNPNRSTGGGGSGEAHTKGPKGKFIGPGRGNHSLPINRSSGKGEVKLTPELAQAFVNLRANADFRVFLEHLVREVNEDTDRVMATEGAVCNRMQGAVVRLQGIYKAFGEAPAALEKFLAARRRP